MSGGNSGYISTFGSSSTCDILSSVFTTQTLTTGYMSYMYVGNLILQFTSSKGTTIPQGYYNFPIQSWTCMGIVATSYNNNMAVSTYNVSNNGFNILVGGGALCFVFAWGSVTNPVGSGTSNFNSKFSGYSTDDIALMTTIYTNPNYLNWSYMYIGGMLIQFTNTITGVKPILQNMGTSYSSAANYTVVATPGTSSGSNVNSIASAINYSKNQVSVFNSASSSYTNYCFAYGVYKSNTYNSGQQSNTNYSQYRTKFNYDMMSLPMIGFTYPTATLMYLGNMLFQFSNVYVPSKTTIYFVTSSWTVSGVVANSYNSVDNCYVTLLNNNSFYTTTNAAYVTWFAWGTT